MGCFRLLSLVHIRKYVFLCNEITIRIPKVHSFLKQCLHDIHFMKTSYPQLKSDEGPCFKNEWNLVRLSLLYVLISVVYLGHWTPNEGIYQRYLKTKYVSAVPKFWDWDWIFGRAVKAISRLNTAFPYFPLSSSRFILHETEWFVYKSEHCYIIRPNLP